MRMILLPLTFSLALASSAALAQQPPATLGDKIGSPPPIAGPPATMPPPASAPDPRPSVSSAANANVEDETPLRKVKPVRCSVAARETDGSTTCIGFVDGPARSRRR
jgi:hypothetical protein